MKAFPYSNVNAETTLQMDTSKKGPGASLTQKVTPMDPEDDIQLPFRKANMITTRNLTRNSTRILMSVQPQDSLSNQLDRLRKSTPQGNQLTRLSRYTNTDFQCDKKNLPTDLHKHWNHRETLSTPFVVSRTFIMLNSNMNTNCMITIQYLMSEHFSDSISNRSAPPEKNILQKKYITRLEGYNNTDQLCDRESSPTDLPESWSHKELLHNIYGLINHGNQIIPVTHKEVYLLSRPLKAMAKWKIQYMPREVYLLPEPSKKKMDPYSLTKQTLVQHRQNTSWEPATVVSQGSSNSYWIMQENGTDQPRVYRRTRSMLKIRCTDIQEMRHNYSQSTESQKAKFQTPSTSNEARNYVKHNSVEKISDDLVHPTKSDTASASIFSESEEREEIAADVPAPAPTLETVEEQSHTPGSRKSTRKNFGRPASTFSDFYM